MRSYPLDKFAVEEFVLENSHRILEKDRFVSRCIDDRIFTQGENMRPLSMPGADLGELAVILATSKSYGFELDREKAVSEFVSILGGFEKFHFHECKHMLFVKENPELYGLNTEDIEFIFRIVEKQGGKKLEEAPDKKAYIYGAVIQINGSQNLFPHYYVTDENAGNHRVDIFVYHRTLIEERHRILAQKLIESHAVTFSAPYDVEYLASALSETAENHLMETEKHLAKGLPIFEVKFVEKDGNFTLNELGSV